MTTRTPLHSTKLPLSIWMKGLWFILQSDKGVSSIRLAEALGVSQPTAWRMGHVLRLLVSEAEQLSGIVEADEFHFGQRTSADPGTPPGRGRKGLPRTEKTPALVMVERPENKDPGAPAGRVVAEVVGNLSLNEMEPIMERVVDYQNTHLMSDEWKAFMAVGQDFLAHDTVRHSGKEYSRGIVHANGTESFNTRVRRTITGVFHHISPEHADLYFSEIGFRWSQRIVMGQAVRTSKKERQRVQVMWSRTSPVLQLIAAMTHAVGRQMRRTKAGSIAIISTQAVFG